MTARARTLWAALTGAVAAGAALATTELLALLLAPASSPVLAVGALAIDLAPPWLKDVMIALFGVNDKLVLLIIVGLLVAVLAVIAGLLERRRPPWGAVTVGVVGIVALVAVLTRAEATSLWAAPTAIGFVVGVLVLRLLTARLRVWEEAAATAAAPAAPVRGAAAPATPASATPVPATPARGPFAPGVPTAIATAPRRPARSDPAARTPADLGRRGFLGMLTATAAGAVVVGLGSRAIASATAMAQRARDAIVLPAAASAAAPLAAGTALDVPGITPLVTPNADFYRIDTALQVPSIDASQWRLRVTGLVEQEVEIGWDELAAMPLQESYVTLMCVSNEVGGDLTGNALWLGHPIRDVLAMARPLPEADMVLSRSQDGWTASTPLDVLTDPDRDALLAIGMNGEPLPLEHGFPVRMVVPGLYGFVSATKWVVELQVTRFDADLAYWSTRGWSERGPVKTHSRIDVPRAFSSVGQGTVAVAGIAWAQHTGIERVEVRVDGGPWARARLADAISIDTWRQWVYEWDATSGSHLLEVRATDAAGMTQRSTQVPVAPDGAEGYHGVIVQVA
ncbi:molybdopterin-dependent oxidoreductase [Microcella flavibacter]|uniref:molybdopterin-dependent oxidoreductase n=1 Tax=Microcella flavibacter TaxID=1804990 RepID=UPI0014576E57|nr:molybdopterin-dependent oxidoreductase [Microcella flavibacter]